MNKRLRLILQILGGIFAALLLALAVLTFIVNTPAMRKRVLRQATEMLSEKLGTKVTIDSVHVDLATQDLELYGVSIDDQQQRKLFEMDQMVVDFDLTKLLANKIEVERAHIKGLRAYIVENPGEAPNYQSILDALKREKDPQEDTIAVRKDGKLKFDLRDINLEDVRLTKKGSVETSLEIGKLEISPEGHVGKLRLSRLHYTTDNHQPRKNAVKPKRGAFDTGHFNVWADLEADIFTMNKDSVFATITNGTVSDTLTGFFIKDLKGRIEYLKGVAHVRDLGFSHLNTKVKIDSAEMQLPNRKKDIPLAYHTGTVTVHTLLKDIATPFAPVLKNFTMPLLLTTTVTGNADGMVFRDVHVFTADRQLDIRARGGISDLKDKHKMVVRFDIERMHTHSLKALEIINQFAVKKLMTDQLKSLTTIDYTGQLGIYWKNERFSGKLKSQEGDINFKISLDETNKYINGNIGSKSFDVGKAFQVKAIGRLAFTGDFRVDFSKERTARMRRDKNGKLPIGTAQVMVKEVQVKKLRYTDIFADITSDGATALLNVDKPGKVANLGFDISYTSTTAGTKVKVKPKLHFNVFKKKQTP